MTIVSVVGTRPHFVKLYAMSQALKHNHSHIVIHTGQHYDYQLSSVFFDGLDMPSPDYFLNVYPHSPARQVAEMMLKTSEVLEGLHPDVVLVYGDTNTTLAGALAASKSGHRLGHVEAGLRSFNRSMPEEHNRVVVDHLSDVLFCPTASAEKNLQQENIRAIVGITGDVTVDVIMALGPIAEKQAFIISKNNLTPGKYIVATIHRQGNTENELAMTEILKAFSLLNESIIFPCHPRTKKSIQRADMPIPANVQIIEPVGYLDMLSLIQNSQLVLTDSGGLQKEAFLLGVPCVTLRDETEWKETVELGWNALGGWRTQSILKAVSELKPQRERTAIFGDGFAAKKILNILQELFE